MLNREYANRKKGIEVHLYREDGRDVWCNLYEDGSCFDGKGNCYERIRPTLYLDRGGEFLHATV